MVRTNAFVLNWLWSKHKYEYSKAKRIINLGKLWRYHLSFTENWRRRANLPEPNARFPTVAFTFVLLQFFVHFDPFLEDYRSNGTPGFFPNVPIAIVDVFPVPQHGVISYALDKLFHVEHCYGLRRAVGRVRRCRLRFPLRRPVRTIADSRRECHVDRNIFFRKKL